MKRVLVAYASYSGNSKANAEELAQGLLARGSQTELVSLDEGRSPSGEWDILVLCSPVRKGAVVPPARKFVTRLDCAGKELALVISHAAPLRHIFSPVRSSERLQARMAKKGMKKAAEITYIRVTGAKGPREEGYAETLARLADTIASP